jgi:hypothetical protein
MTKYTILAGMLLAAPMWAKDAETIVKDRKAFLPHQQHQSLPGKVVGILIENPAALLAHEGRSGPPDQFCFAHGNASYRWVYVVTEDAQPQISDLRVRAGEKGEIELRYPKLRIANLASLAPLGVKARYTLVEIEINEGKGSPAEDALVATGVFVVEGSKKYPFKTAELLDKVARQHADWTRTLDKDIDRALADLTAKTLGDKKPLNPRKTTELVYVTWLPETECIRVHFVTKHALDDIREVEEGPEPQPRPAEGKDPPAPGLPPPPRFRVASGVTFGVEFGRAYEISKTGDIKAVARMPLETFVHQQPPRPLPRPVRGDPD